MYTETSFHASHLLATAPSYTLSPPPYPEDTVPVTPPPTTRENPKEKYAYDYLSQRSGVFTAKGGRRVLWRVKQQTTLLLAPLDLSGESTRSTLVQFPAEVLDVSSPDTKYFHILTAANLIYTLRLATGEFDVHFPPTFTFHAPFFLQSVSASTVLVALNNGSVLRLDRVNQGWTENIYTDNWGISSAIKGLLPFGGRGRIPSNLVCSMKVVQKHNILLTVSIDAKLKVWSLDRGHLIHTIALNNARPTTPTDQVLRPSRQVYTLVPATKGPYAFYVIAASGSSLDSTFTMFGAPSSSPTDLAPLHPDIKARAPEGGAVWLLADLVMTREDKGRTAIWALWKSNTSSSIQRLVLDPTATMSIEPNALTHGAVGGTDFENKWESVGSDVKSSLKPLEGAGSIATEGGQGSTSADIAESWANKIFMAGRFSIPAMHFALTIYAENFRPNSASSGASTFSSVSTLGESTVRSLRSQAMKLVGTNCVLETDTVTGQLVYEKYRMDLALEWGRFARVCAEFERAGTEGLSLGVGEEGDIWVVRAERVGLVRRASALETAVEVARSGSKRVTDVAELLRAARVLRQGISEEGVDDTVVVLTEDASQLPNFSVEDRVWGVWERGVGGGEGVATKDAVHEILDAVSEGDEAVTRILDMLCVDALHGTEFPIPATQGELSIVGAALLRSGVNEMVRARWEVLLDVLLLAVFSACNEEEVDYFDGVDAIYDRALGLWKGYSILKQAIDTFTGEGKADETVLEVVKKVSAVNVDLEVLNISGAFEKVLGELKAVADVDRFAIRVASALVTAGHVEEAVGFQRWLPQSAWGVYVCGRVLLEAEKYDEAERLFTKGAVGVAQSSEEGSVDLLEEGIVGDLLVEGDNAFGNGMPYYYAHVATLFENKLQHDAVVQSCQKALIGLTILPVPDEILEQEIVQRMLKAAIAGGMWDEAYTAMTRVSSAPRQRDALKELIPSMCEQNMAERMCSYPFFGLLDEVDAILAQKAKNMVDVRAQPQYHKILYSWRVSHSNFRGAASAMYECAQQLRNVAAWRGAEYLEITEAYLSVITALSCVDPDNAWIFTHRVKGGDEQTEKKIKIGRSMEGMIRVVLSLDEIRKEYKDALTKMETFLALEVFKDSRA
ncbi:hypothetical protein G7K_5264-t1 [Saitoella complicata NRRL Y-17804]|uniref:Uncharacterized protein n=2 Tax=Saitoella complicata (strain BCRC 22490 / CBS 7301 / JCM 7358 / NBRC 10748 / NRRL Y-17804) TaxID=698492 RepID=A0A0E9NMX2_SAICN|nr:hypothetical protein G7K_5264-t1 [Saitoella complicata NRRL Y-17804]